MRLDAISPLTARVAQPAELRAALYAAVMHPPGGSPDGATANRAFNDLWLRFVSAVAQCSRRQSPAALAEQAAQRLATAAGARIEQARGSADLHNVLDRLATTELGGAANPARFRVLAQSGGMILERLAAGRHDGGAPDPTEADLADACELWLAAHVAGDGDIDALARPGTARAQVETWSRSLDAAVGVPLSGHDHRAGTPRIAAVFSGPAGTGKTLAAHWLGARSGQDLLRVDLGAVTSRYIGETEKNLDRVFGAAQESGAFLLLDEGDALLGKRTDVRDAHDRYANVEVGLLARRLAEFPGNVVLLIHAEPGGVDLQRLERTNTRLVAFPLPPC